MSIAGKRDGENFKSAWRGNTVQSDSTIIYFNKSAGQDHEQKK